MGSLVDGAERQFNIRVSLAVFGLLLFLASTIIIAVSGGNWLKELEDFVLLDNKSIQKLKDQASDKHAPYAIVGVVLFGLAVLCWSGVIIDLILSRDSIHIAKVVEEAHPKLAGIEENKKKRPTTRSSSK